MSTVNLLLHASIVASCAAYVIGPCGMSMIFKYLYYSEIHPDDVPLAMCIAGYHNYDTDFKLTHSNGTSYGIFGLRVTESCAENALTERNYTAELKCLQEQVFQDAKTLHFYNKLCEPKLARRVVCKEIFTGKITGEVWDPIHKEIISQYLRNNQNMEDILAHFDKDTS